MSQEASRFGLEINGTKTKIQPIGVQGTIPNQTTRWSSSAASAILAPVWRRTGGSGPEVCRRVAIARDCMSSLQRRIWKTGIRIDTKLCLFQAYILPILLYGTETWTLTRALETKLHVYQRWCFRGILRVPFSPHSFIHSGHFYSTPSSPLLLTGAPDYSTDTVSEFHTKAHRQLQVKDLPKVPTWRLEWESNPRPSG